MTKTYLRFFGLLIFMIIVVSYVFMFDSKDMYDTCDLSKDPNENS